MNSVVIPCYNVCNEIESVLSEIPNIIDRIYVVNDASTDNTLDVINKYSYLDNRIVVISNDKNLGVGGATIHGFKKALIETYEFFSKMSAPG